MFKHLRIGQRSKGLNDRVNVVHLQFKAKSGYVIKAGLSWSPNTETDTKPRSVLTRCSCW